MELCPKCKHMTAERNHYTHEVICYNVSCEKEASELQKIHGCNQSLKSTATMGKTPRNASR